MRNTGRNAGSLQIFGKCKFVTCASCFIWSTFMVNLNMNSTTHFKSKSYQWLLLTHWKLDNQWNHLYKKRIILSSEENYFRHSFCFVSKPEEEKGSLFFNTESVQSSIWDQNHKGMRKMPKETCIFHTSSQCLSRLTAKKKQNKNRTLPSLELIWQNAMLCDCWRLKHVVWLLVARIKQNVFELSFWSNLICNPILPPCGHC